MPSVLRQPQSFFHVFIVLPPTPLIEKTAAAAKMTAFAKRTVHRLFIRPAADICPFTVRFSVMYLELFSS